MTNEEIKKEYRKDKSFRPKLTTFSATLIALKAGKKATRFQWIADNTLGCEKYVEVLQASKQGYEDFVQMVFRANGSTSVTSWRFGEMEKDILKEDWIIF